MFVKIIDLNFSEFLMIIYIKYSQCARWYKMPVVKVIIMFYEMELFSRETLDFFFFSNLGENKE